MDSEACPRPQRGSLYRVTLELLRSGKLTNIEIHKRSGVSFGWLNNIRYNEVRDPGVNNVQALYEFLTGKKLDI